MRFDAYKVPIMLRNHTTAFQLPYRLPKTGPGLKKSPCPESLKTSSVCRIVPATQQNFPTVPHRQSPAMQALRLAQFLALGYSNFGVRGFRANELHFAKDALDVDLRGRHYLVTGPTSGLGRVTASALAVRGAHVHLLCRDATRGDAVRDEIVAESGNENVRLHVCDISSLADISGFSHKWNKSKTPITALVNNAGAMLHDVKMSADGMEMGFATNTLGTFALTEMLRPCFESGGGGRVVTVSSGGMLTQPLIVDTLEGQDLVNGDKIDGSSQYSRSKRHQVALTEHWARKYADKGIFWASVHPGWAGTPGLEKAMPGFFQATKNQLRSEEQGADGIIYLAIADDAVSYANGEFFFDRCPAGKHLWLGGTQYANGDADRLADRLRKIVEEKGYTLPK